MIHLNDEGKFIKIVFILTVLAISHCNLSVYNLESLGVKNQALKNIKYSVANFGFAPLGKTIIGKLSLSPNFSSQCKVQNDGNNYQNTFMLIPRGQCQFATKALNAQSLGVQMAIIMDNSKHENLLIMVDNGYGYKVKIPSIFINYQDGEILKQMLNENPESSIMLKMVFQNKKTEKVDVKFYLQSYNRQSNRLVDNFRKFYPLIKDHINFNLIYSVIQCEKCKKQDCYFDNKFCAQNLIHQESALANGQLILDQQIRQQIIFDQQPEKWWKYMQYINDECGVLVELKDCGQKAMNKENIQIQQVQKAFKGSFDKQSNLFLNKNKQDLHQVGIIKFPTVTLNDQKIKGSLNGQYIFDDICNLLENPPSECEKYVNTDSIQYKFNNQFPTLLLVIIIGIILFSIIFIVYRRYMKRKISSQMQGRVDDMVSKYIQFYSQRSRNK